MSPGAPLESTLPESWSSSPPGSTNRFGSLRGVRWRIGLGILPPSSSIDDLRRVTADSRRRYASLRRCLLVDPHLPKDGSNSPDCVMDNPLSQNPDSMWGRFFRNAELERMVDQDLSRLYPEHGSYFQTLGCQSTLRRILLLWCLKHPESGYRQGMHELLAPLLYVLHADVEYLLNVRKLYEDHFVDKFDEFLFEDNDLSYNFDFQKFSESRKDELYSEKCPSNCISINELDPEVQDIVLLSDAYGAEGELGVVISDKYMEHDAYCMFDALMSGAGGEVSMAKFFLPSPSVNSHTGLPPVIEASSALYHLLSIVDSSIHSHLIELGVEPQYFSLRWLRVLFGREFSLEDLVIIWDEIFSCDNRKIDKCTDDSVSSFSVLGSLRGAFISAFAVSMIVCTRSSLLATENATSCLQRLLNFPANKDLKKILTKAKSLQPLALDANTSTPLPLHNGIYERNKPIFTRGSESVSPRTPLSLVPESYWEEKWRDLHKAEKLRESSLDKHVPSRKKGWSEKIRSKLLRAESAPSSSKDPKSVRRSLLEDLSKQLESEDDVERTEDMEELGQGSTTQGEIKEHKDNNNNANKNMCFFNEDKNLACSDEERCSSGSMGSGDNNSSFSESLDHNHYENQSGISSVASNLSAVENDDEGDNSEPCGRRVEESPLPLSDPPDEMYLDAGLHKESEGKRVELDPLEYNFEKSQDNKDSLKETGSGLNERKLLSGKFQWFWRFGRNNSSFKGASEKRVPENTKACNGAHDQSNIDTSAGLAPNGPSSSLVSCEGESADQNMMLSLRNLGRTMLDNIQVIESVFQQERGQEGSMENSSKNVVVGKGQETAMSALKELRKISNLLSEM